MPEPLPREPVEIVSRVLKRRGYLPDNDVLRWAVALSIVDELDRAGWLARPAAIVVEPSPDMDSGGAG